MVRINFASLTWASAATGSGSEGRVTRLSFLPFLPVGHAGPLHPTRHVLLALPDGGMWKKAILQCQHGVPPSGMYGVVTKSLLRRILPT